MNSRLAKLVSITLLIAGAAAIAAADEKERQCSAPARVCEQEIRRMLTGRRYLGVQLMELNPGLLVKGVVADSPAEKADFKAGDRLMAVNGHSTTDATIKDFKQLLSASRSTGMLFVIVQRRGALRQITVRLEPYSDAQVDKIIAQHLATSHAQTATTNP